MNCEWVRENISAFIDGELNIEMKEMMDRHFGECSGCKAEFDRFKSAWDALSLWEDEQPPAYLKESIFKAVRRTRSSRLLRMLLPVAAVLVMALGIVLFYGKVNHFDTVTVVSDKQRVDIPVQAPKGDLDEDEIIANLQIIEEQDFFDSLDVLKNIDYLPIIENHDDNRSSMGYFSA